ncbi:DEAD/DEAH box helicase [Evansella clarkii]|uniref:DEAD/DEAH box helicase n=1 Tax=Evansella clarkii TaxID=79879 RepID=UPI0009986F45|nr:DEAD/DEAH box helicase [Evansella clarkii]
MDEKEKRKLTSINKIDVFNSILKKITKGESLENNEKSYILSCAIMFIQHYEQDRRYTSYLEFGYYIILKYSIQYQDYSPLFDFALNFGFYPIAKEIINHNLLDEVKLNDSLIELKLDSYINNGYIETYEQNKARLNLINNSNQEMSYVAPTSFGKSSLIIEHLLSNINKRVGIIVPTKSLLTQTYKLIREANLKKRMLIHDEMYQQDEEFIAVLTQERALRLLDKHDTAFDILYIDEAHNIFDNDPRNIMLSRLIRKNRVINPQQKVVYLSPLITDSNNLKFDDLQEISEQRITHNLKEPEIYEYRLNGEVYQYNRFVNEFFYLKSSSDSLSYIIAEKRKKNFIYIRSPKKIEMFANEFADELKLIKKTDDLEELLDELKRFVHKDFFMIDLLLKGVMYLHGKLPDILKEYLEFKFKKISDLKFVVANSVILEGINLPIDTLFILNTYELKEKKLTNLIGRVNRLNNIFGSKNENRLEKLLPRIHFVNHETYNRTNSKMENQITTLRSNIFKDEIKNPVLNTFDIEKVRGSQNLKEKLINIKENEDFVFNEEQDELSKLRRYLINSGIEPIYKLDEFVLEKILERLKGGFREFIKNWSNMDLIDKIYCIFIYGLEDYVTDYEFYRLKYIESRNFYKMHILNSRKKSLKENIESTYTYFKRRAKSNNSLFFMGESYGEVVNENNRYISPKRVYVDLSKKTDVEIINLAIVKLKLEDNFVDHKLNKLIIALFDYNLITEDSYYLAIYGTKDLKKIEFIKTGLSLNLINQLQKDDQLANITFDDKNNIQTNEEFKEYKKRISGLYRFELDKYL